MNFPPSSTRPEPLLKGAQNLIGERDGGHWDQRVGGNSAVQQPVDLRGELLWIAVASSCSSHKPIGGGDCGQAHDRRVRRASASRASHTPPR